MNSTLWNSTGEVVGHFALGGVTFFLYSYAVFLCYAIYDYQDEKPDDEKSPINVHLKDLMNSNFYFLYYFGLVQFISLFTPPITSNIVYFISHVSVFLSNFSIASFFVYLYIRSIFIFYPERVQDLRVSTLRITCFALKIFITIISILISMAFPLENQPTVFQLLAKGRPYDR